MPYEIAIVNPRKVSKKKKHRRSIASVIRAAESVKTNPKGKSMKKRRKGKQPAALKAYWAKHRRKHNPKKKVARKKAARRKVAKKKRLSGVGIAVPAGAKLRYGYTVGSKPVRRYKLNPRKRRHARKKHHARRRHHNPRLLTGFMSQLQHGAMGAAGALGVNVVLGYLPLPVTLKTGLAGKAVKLVGAAGVGMLAGRFLGSAKGTAIAQGAITVALYDMFKGLLNQAAPNIQVLSGDDSMGYLDPAMTINGDDFGAYMNGDDTYLPAGVSGDNDIGAYMNGDDFSGDESVGAYMNGDDILAGSDF